MNLRRWIGLALWMAIVPAASVAQPPPDITVIEEPRAEPLPTPTAYSQQVKKQKGPWLRVVASSSMAPTLLNGDRLAMVKLSEPPKRGDVVLLEHTRDGRYWFLKRIVGLPGDVVQMKGGRLFLNGQEVRRTTIRTVTYADDASGPPSTTATEYEEQLPGENKPHLIHEFSDQDLLDETPAFFVPEGHFFVMGDNRDNSEDSRTPSGHRANHAELSKGWLHCSWPLSEDPRHDAIGFVPAENLISRAETVVFSLNGCRLTKRMIAAGVECLKPNINKRL